MAVRRPAYKHLNLPVWYWLGRTLHGTFVVLAYCEIQMYRNPVNYWLHIHAFTIMAKVNTDFLAEIINYYIKILLIFTFNIQQIQNSVKVGFSVRIPWCKKKSLQGLNKSLNWINPKWKEGKGYECSENTLNKSKLCKHEEKDATLLTSFVSLETRGEFWRC